MKYGWIEFLKDKIVYITALCMICIMEVLFLRLIEVNGEIIGLMAILLLFPFMIIFSIQFLKKRNYYHNLHRIMSGLEQKTLLPEMMVRPDGLEEGIFYELMVQMAQSMNDEIAVHQREQLEYREYIESWVHEIKTPLTGLELYEKNHRTEDSYRLRKLIHKVDQYVEQALYYARSTTLEKDFFIERICLKDLVEFALKQYSSVIIEGKPTVREEELEFLICADKKWMTFIFGQVLLNAVKYRKDPMVITFRAREQDDFVILDIMDNGIGISEGDINRIFDKGFTGENGRKYGKSTGIGLYLSRVLCEKMNIRIIADSKEGEYTTIQFLFPINQMVEME